MQQAGRVEVENVSIRQSNGRLCRSGWFRARLDMPQRKDMFESLVRGMDVVGDANERHIDEGYVKMKAYELESEARRISHHETWEEADKAQKAYNGNSVIYPDGKHKSER